jgi:DNA (cytosine-5)-methyltransferase 1
MRLLDLFCGAGGATRGYQLAGFEVWGVDIKPQPNYCGDRFIQGSALNEDDLPAVYAFDAIHASPPCQAFTSLRDMHNAKDHDDLLTPTREMLRDLGLPYIIENVEGAPMIDYITLCGSSFGLGAQGARLQRHRRFETSFPVMAPPCAHGVSDRVIGVYGGHGRDHRRKVNTQNYSTEARREAMGIDWMSGAELSQAIPPAYTEHIGGYLMDYLTRCPTCGERAATGFRCERCRAAMAEDAFRQAVGQ